MSHTAKIDVEMKDQEALKKACYRIEASGKETINGNYTIWMPGNKFTCNVNTQTGVLSYDTDYANDQSFYALQNAYGAEVAIQQAQEQGYTYDEHTDEQGNITLNVYV